MKNPAVVPTNLPLLNHHPNNAANPIAMIRGLNDSIPATTFIPPVPAEAFNPAINDVKSNTIYGNPTKLFNSSNGPCCIENGSNPGTLMNRKIAPATIPMAINMERKSFGVLPVTNLNTVKKTKIIIPRKTKTFNLAAPIKNSYKVNPSTNNIISQKIIIPQSLPDVFPNVAIFKSVC